MTDAKVIRAAFRVRLGRFALDAAFAVPAVGVTALFGPSGCGKTTVLRCLAGLERAEEGSCVVDGEVWQDETSFRPAHRRAVGYVFQEASLFPHLSVRGNLLFGAPRRGAGDERARVHFDEIIDLLGLDGLLDRSPNNLSGGERQRVAVGRALLSEPKLLLMDEPLSALDRQTKDEILPFLERLHDRLKLPVIYVSHDLSEVERLADHLVLMEEGRVRASGPLAEIQSDPDLPFATAREAAISFDAVIEALDPAFGLVTLKVDGGRFVIPAAAGTIGERRRLRISAGDVSLARDPPGATTILNVLPAQIIAEAKVGPHEMLAVLGLGPGGKGARLLARVTRRSWEQLQLEIGLAVYAQVKGVALARR